MVLLLLAVILAAGVFLRGQAYLGTEVVEPLQAESAEAYALAQTLSQQGAYEVLAAPFNADAEVTASAETFSGLGYPLFLSLFTAPDSGSGDLGAAVLTQMVLNALAILLVFMLATRLLDPYWGLTAALLTAASPFLINVSLYLVGGTLLMVALLLHLVTSARLGERGGMIRTLIASALLGVAALVDPTFEFLILPWVLLLFFSTKGFAKVLTAVAAIVGFGLVFSPLIMQNQAALDAPVASAPIAASIQQGMQPGAASESSDDAGVGASLAQLGQQFLADPRGFLRWYFVDKTEALWSWDEPAAIGESFVYPVSATPYADNPGFLASEEFARILHGPVVLIGALGAILVWLPFAARRLTPAQRIGLRSISLVLIYATIAHGFGVAAPQYATPLLPLLFVMALTPLYVVTLKRRDPAAAAQPQPAKQEAPAGEPQPEAA
jgi:hypothetical protein